ncbi:NAD(P)-dependent oxidoreductase [Pandoraea terrae]|uniref:NAD(P)-dependent oxidoreductase n=1 Tax=Pandoraea terrae TaxID=1537710 RepID=A0A5E4REV6_9BURK|nr:NAD(P)-dependent oxidoreductase [Pandoraea terrae]VVD61363.1 NAD(P)-dependent oxidoreductase [Pandoraea terrae]
MNIAIIGLGEVGRCYAHALAGGSDVTLLLCEQRISESAAQLASGLKLSIHESVGPWLNDADWVLSCVVGTKSLHVAQHCFGHMKQEAAFADFTTAAPDEKRQAAVQATDKGIAYADVAIMGAIALLGARTPLLCSGDAADAFSSLLSDASGAAPDVLPNSHAGDAMSLKILRSVFTKGMEALAVEVLMAAERQGLRPALYDVLQDIDKASLPQFLEMLVTTHVIHARRRMHEVDEAERQLASIGILSDVLDGVQHRFARTAEKLDVLPLPTEKPTLQDALNWLSSEAVIEAA